MQHFVDPEETSVSSMFADFENEIEAFGEMSLDVEEPRMVQVQSVPWGKLLRRCSQGSKSGSSLAATLTPEVLLKAINWSDLPPELVTEIFQRLKSYQDFVCFASTCCSWRLLGTKDKFTGHYQFPWLMLAEEEGSDLRCFYNVLKDKSCYLELPEANGKRVLSSHGWLLTVDTRLETNLLHPLSRVQIKLPHANSLDPLDRDGVLANPAALYHLLINKIALSSSPGKTSDFSVGVLATTGRIAVCRNGAASWTLLDHLPTAFDDIVFYGGLFYATLWNGSVYECDIGGGRTELVAKLPEGSVDGLEKLYLVESNGTLLMVSRSGATRDDNGDYGTYEFQVFEVSFCRTNRQWNQVTDLGSRALFLGLNSSFSVEASDFPGCKQNCIYFTDDCMDAYYGAPRGGGKDMGVYNLGEGRIEPHFSGESFNRFSPPMWVELII